MYPQLLVMTISAETLKIFRMDLCFLNYLWQLRRWRIEQNIRCISEDIRFFLNASGLEFCAKFEILLFLCFNSRIIFSDVSHSGTYLPVLTNLMALLYSSTNGNWQHHSYQSLTIHSKKLQLICAC